MVDILILGYGNELRGDDGLGPFLARSIATANFPGVRVLISRQLLPEFAADLAQSKLVVFVDASQACSERGFEVRSLAAENVTDWSTHYADPRALLALTQAIYRQKPDAWWLTVSGHDFDLGERLSLVAKQNARRALVWLRQVVDAPKRQSILIAKYR